MSASGAKASAYSERRFGGLARLYGAAGAKRIQSSHIVVIGVGGVGAWAAEAAARSGVPRLTLIDLDHIAESNINRQVHALTNTIGMAKVEAMRQRIVQINEACQVDCVEEFVDADNWPAIAGLASDIDWTKVAIIDACDQVKAKTAIAAWALRHNAAFISVGAAGGKQLAHKVDIDDLSLVTHDPLLAQMRYRLRRQYGAAQGTKKIGIACVFSREPVVRPEQLDDEPKSADVFNSSQQTIEVQTDSTLNCHGYGSVVAVTATFGQCATGWVVAKIAKAT
jgi:tRNA threonylcarbamoyladenosine dehydratase